MGRFVQVLVVDSDPQIKRSLRSALLAQGYDVRVAKDSESALDGIESWTPDLIITGLVMPNMDGIDLCRSLRTRRPRAVIASAG